jgi:hypothetical protein
LAHPVGAGGVGLPLEHMAVQFVNDLLRIRRAGLLGGNGRGK